MRDRAFAARFLVVAAMFVGALGVGGKARAAETAADHYDKGLALIEMDADPMTTLIEFLRAYKLDPKPGNGRLIGTHYLGYDPEFQITKIYARLGRTEEAKKYLDLCEQYGYTAQSVNRKEYLELRSLLVTEIEALQSQSAPPETSKRAETPAPEKAQLPGLPPPSPATTATSTAMTPVELPTQSQGIKNVPTKDPPPWDQSVRSALQLYLSGAPRNEISRQLARARAFGALEALDRPGALYVIACFYAEEYVRSSSVSDLQLAKTAYRRLLEVAPGYVPSAPSLRQAKIEKLLNR